MASSTNREEKEKKKEKGKSLQDRFHWISMANNDHQAKIENAEITDVRGREPMDGRLTRGRETPEIKLSMDKFEKEVPEHKGGRKEALDIKVRAADPKSGNEKETSEFLLKLGDTPPLLNEKRFISPKRGRNDKLEVSPRGKADAYKETKEEDKKREKKDGGQENAEVSPPGEKHGFFSNKKIEKVEKNERIEKYGMFTKSISEHAPRAEKGTYGMFLKSASEKPEKVERVKPENTPKPAKEPSTKPGKDVSPKSGKLETQEQKEKSGNSPRVLRSGLRRRSDKTPKFLAKSSDAGNLQALEMARQSPTIGRGLAEMSFDAFDGELEDVIPFVMDEEPPIQAETDPLYKAHKGGLNIKRLFGKKPKPSILGSSPTSPNVTPRFLPSEAYWKIEKQVIDEFEATSLEDFLCNIEGPGYHSFSLFMNSETCAEILFFWTEINNLHQLPQGHSENVENILKGIYNTYIKIGGKLSQSLPAPIIQNIKKKLKVSTCDTNLYNEAHDHVTSSLKLNFWIRYPYTPFYRDYIVYRCKEAMANDKERNHEYTKSSF
eukprot:TRINITY_DN1697_c2_g1_i1.p1 TRINITY_DN1697_c2_g1~~TRINITY_DN1697_c2_g1_i1.p1  ORF type:complete len:549 (+),score=107.37 TRINITY_DN1697_c2_g1_i1:707-2353(+)